MALPPVNDPESEVHEANTASDGPAISSNEAVSKELQNESGVTGEPTRQTDGENGTVEEEGAQKQQLNANTVRVYPPEEAKKIVEKIKQTAAELIDRWSTLPVSLNDFEAVK